MAMTPELASLASLFDTPGALPLVLPEWEPQNFADPPWWLVRELNWIGYREVVHTWRGGAFGPKLVHQRMYCWRGERTSLDAWRRVKYGPPKTVTLHELWSRGEVHQG